MLKGMSLSRAKKYLNNVLRHTEIVTFTRYTGGNNFYSKQNWLIWK